MSAVRVFESAARLENFTAAAAELGMTQAAVSHQIRVLEDRLGVKLFRREKQRVFLTPAARRAATLVGRGLDEIAAAFADLRSDDETTLTVSTTTTFANAWLAWKIGGFQLRHPEIAIRMQVDNRVSDLSTEEVDVAIRLGFGGWEGLHVEHLLSIDFTPMCSPAFLAQHGGALRPEDVLTLPTISSHQPDWIQWLEDAGQSPETLRERPVLRLDSQANEGHAAMAGQGLAILTPFFWRQDVADGRLVRPFEQRSTLGQSYWFVTSEHRRRTPKIRRFQAWLTEEIARDRATMEREEAARAG